MSNKRVVVVHCWEGKPEYYWYQSVRKELESKGFKVDVPEMPETRTPHLSTWLPMLKNTIGKPDVNLYLVGHSLGCITILRYLESLHKDERIGGTVLVAGFSEAIGYPEIESFFTHPIDFDVIRAKSANGFVAIHSDNDKYVDLRHAAIFKGELGAKVIIMHNADHFTGSNVYAEKECKELPEVVESILRLSGK